MKTTIKLWMSIVTVTLLMSACAQRTVTRVSPDQQIDLSGRWNDTDSKLVADEMINDMINRPWREQFVRSTNQRPVMIVGMITNRTTEHIESETFIKDIERELINSGLVRIVQNAAFREKMREERADQTEFASLDTQARWGRELGADFMLMGIMSSTTDAYKKQRVVNYKINLELANLETNEKVWIGDKEIKKYIRN